jgi:hypothetical protein
VTANSVDLRYDRLRELLERKAHDLLTAYGVACAPGPPMGLEEQICAVLGFTGDHLRGSVLVVGTVSAIAASNPSPDSGPGAWAGELANQLVGRFKNDLLRYGIDVTMSIPVVLTATRIQPLSRRAREPIELAVGPGAMTLLLEVEGDAELTDAPMESEPLAIEGDMLMF